MYLQLLTLLFLFLPLSIFAQRADYFQQKVSYTIDVELIPHEKILKGMMEVTYTNQSPDNLDVIWFHMYPNAFKDESTPFARQQRDMKRWTFSESKPEEKGWIEADFFFGSEKLNKEFKKDAIDEVKVYLPKTLSTGDSITLKVPFEVKIPKVFSRLGYEGNNFGVTQWYPKVVVYDQDGWHPDSYLDYGEFYGEFSSFRVSITIPESFTVDATGLMDLNPAEQSRIDSLITIYQKFKALTFPEERKIFTEKFKDLVNQNRDSLKTKTLTFRASMVPDFAWFASEQFLVDKSVNPDGVISYALIQPNNFNDWKNAARYATEAVNHYGKMVGKYPYPKASVVDGALDAGGGMEYPMITVISMSNPPGFVLLDEVITHEVGHNWFQSILGSNERAHAWMDEGINSYYEMRTLDDKYGSHRSFLSDPDSLGFLKSFLRPVGILEYSTVGYNLVAFKNLDLPNNLPADLYHYNGNAAVHYQKSVLMLKALESYLGREKMDKAMQNYYQQWKFKHPRPDDFITAVEQSVGEDLNWFFDPWLKEKRVADFALDAVKTEGDSKGLKSTIYLTSKGDFSMPVPVRLVTEKNDTLYQTWDPKKGNSISFTHLNQVQSVVVNPDMDIYEMNYLNNYEWVPVNVNFLAAIPSLQAWDLNFFPVVDYENTTDGFQMGAGVWGGNILTGDNLILATVYTGFSSGAVGYRLNFKDRVPRFLLDYTDWGFNLYDQEGFRKQEAYLVVTSNERYYKSSVTLAGGLYSLYDKAYVNPLVYSAGDYSTVDLTLRASNSLRWYAASLKASVSQGISLRDQDPSFTKLESQFNFRYNFSSTHSIRYRFFAGASYGSLPLQEEFFLGGGVDPRRSAIFFDYGGNFSFLNNVVDGSGLFLPGYAVTDQAGTLRGRAGMSHKVTVDTFSGIKLFADAGQVYKDVVAFGSNSFVYDAGFGFTFGPYEILFPVWISDPLPGDKNTDFRFVLNFNAESFLSPLF